VVNIIYYIITCYYVRGHGNANLSIYRRTIIQYKGTYIYYVDIIHLLQYGSHFSPQAKTFKIRTKTEFNEICIDIVYDVCILHDGDDKLIKKNQLR